MSATEGKLVFPLLVDERIQELGVNEVNTFVAWANRRLSILDGKVDIDGDKLDKWICNQTYRSIQGHPRVGVVINTVFQKRKKGEYDDANGKCKFDAYQKALEEALKNSGEEDDEKSKEDVEKEWETFATKRRGRGIKIINDYRNLLVRHEALNGEVPKKKMAEVLMDSVSEKVQDVWTVSLSQTSAQQKDPDIIIQKLAEMCKTTKGDEAAPKTNFPYRAAPKDVCAVIKEEIAAFVGGRGNPRRDQVIDRRPKPASSNSRRNPRHSQQQSSEGLRGRKCWWCGIIGCNPDTCKSHEKPCDCCGNKGHWKVTCQCKKCKRDCKAGGKGAGGSKETGRNGGKNNQRTNYLAESIVDEEFSEFPFAGDACTVAMQCSNCRHDIGRAIVNTGTDRPLAVTLATVYAFGLSILQQQSAAESIASLAVVITLLSQINWLDCIVQVTVIGFAVALHLLLYTLCAFASCLATIISAVVKTGFEVGVIALRLEATTLDDNLCLEGGVQQAGLQGRRPPPSDLEVRHLLARIGGFGGDVNRAIHSIEGNIPSREGDNNRRDRHGGESDREDEEP
uniref:Uncharacterized protein n=1 Tax=Chromera velia CCMP2878 TaxID=1169474 RepID=A0A0G4HUR7_9ALVE|eukprot:Cvel_8706.t1-p1 / transcript=Cvel_8706.t1 / gene=Cvel_8706 / organism=Chromera_velia_CCMP2878 / gene_product=hypothetical protein / transcript_product=hypothetical protein / location=Cvel_scaffold486:24804-27527(+) / protein_length=565 / sequence_SO=supercontig / SO=protein_coding / is_pseudo=false